MKIKLNKIKMLYQFSRANSEHFRNYKWEAASTLQIYVSWNLSSLRRFVLKGQSHELRMRDFLPLGALTQDHAVISRHYRYGFHRR